MLAGIPQGTFVLAISGSRYTLLPAMLILITWLRWWLLGFHHKVIMFTFEIDTYSEKHYFESVIIFSFSSYFCPGILASIGGSCL